MEDRLRALVRRRELSGTGLRRLFRQFDTSRSGRISRSEFRRGLDELGFSATESEVRELVARFDSDGDGMIDYEEFASFALPSTTTRRSDPLRSSFPEWDTTSGTARRKVDTMEERVRAAVRRAELGHGGLRRLFASADENGSGRVDRAEMQSVLEALGVRATEAESAELIARFDVDGDGRIDWRVRGRIVAVPRAALRSAAARARSYGAAAG